MKILIELGIGVGGCALILAVAFLAARRWAVRLGVDHSSNHRQKSSLEL